MKHLPIVRIQATPDSVMRLRSDYFQQDDQVKFYRASRAVHLVRWAMNRDEEKDNLDTGNSDFPY